MSKQNKTQAPKPAPERSLFDPLPESAIHYLKDEHGSERKELGIDYDWEHVRKMYKALNCPPGFYDPTTMPVSEAAHNVLFSARSTGKTTNVLLFFMCAAWAYSGEIIYCRQRDFMIEKGKLDKLFEIIRAFHYVSKITGGRYTDVNYYSRAWRYVNRDDTGKIIEQSDPFCVCVAVDRNEVYKSTLNAPRGDFLVYDEFISSDYEKNEFIHFLDLCKTIFRDRISPVVVWVCNNTDPWSEYLRELNVQGVVARMCDGESAYVKTSKGTVIYCERVGVKSEIRKVVNSKYYGFDNPLINSITGGDGWNIDCFPHIEDDDTREVLTRGIFVEFENTITELELCVSENVGLHILAHKATKVSDKAVCDYTLGDISKLYHAYGFGPGRKIDKVVWGLYTENKWYFSNNEVGNICLNYYNRARKL